MPCCTPTISLAGTPFYYNSAGTIVTLPLGTVTIQETKAPEGYLINNETVHPADHSLRQHGIR